MHVMNIAPQQISLQHIAAAKFSAREQSLVVVFVDICNSTRMFVDYGNELALAKISRCLKTLRSIIQSHSGSTINTFGDGLLCTFPAPDLALQAALEFQIAAHEQTIAIHGGMHCGAVISQDDSIYGDTVNMASRLADLAQDDEILFSKEIRDRLSHDRQEHVKSLGALTLKGKASPMDVYLLSSPSGIKTACHKVLTLPDAQPAQKLELTYRSVTMTLGGSNSDFILGRAHDAHLIIESRYASRQHATIQCRSGKFFLVDHSSNGSYLLDHEHRLIAMARDTYQLQRSGFISLGSIPKPNNKHLISYRIV